MSVYDLSKYQPAGRIEALVNSGKCDGVILKLGEQKETTGEIELDPMFITHVNEAVRFNLPYGIYIMSRANNAEEMLQEAQWVNDRIYELLNSQLPALGVWIDLERPEVQRDDIWEDTHYVIQQMRSWWATDRVGIYASRSYFTGRLDLDAIAVEKIPIWTADYHSNYDILKTDYPDLRVVLWQFTTNGNTQDENVWYGF